MPGVDGIHDLDHGEPRLCLERSAPQRFELVVRGAIVDALVVGIHHRDEAGIGGTLHVVLAAQRMETRARPADLPGHHGERDQATRVVGAVDVLRYSHPPKDHRSARRREEAREHLPLRRQAHARARAAERLRDRGDDANLAGAVGVAPALRHFAEVIRLQRLDRPLLRDRLGDLAAGHDVVAAPAVRVADVHVLDEADDVPRAAEMAGHVDDARVVRAALHHHVDLDREELGLRGGVDRVEHARDREVDVVHPPEHLVVERVEADGDAAQARVAQRVRLRAGQQRAVRRQGEVGETADAREHLHEALEVAADQRLAAGQADLADCHRRHQRDQPLDLLEAQDLVALEPRQPLGGHAVLAAEVAAVGDRHAQIADPAAVPVDKRIHCHGSKRILPRDAASSGARVN